LPALSRVIVAMIESSPTVNLDVMIDSPFSKQKHKGCPLIYRPHLTISG